MSSFNKRLRYYRDGSRGIDEDNENSQEGTSQRMVHPRQHAATASTSSAAAADACRAAQLQLDEAFELEIKVKERVASAVQGKHQAQVSYFGSIVNRLHNNDPALVTIHSNECASLTFPDGYGMTLGQALLYNTKVAHIELDIGNILSNETQCAAAAVADDNHQLRAVICKDLQGLLRFLATSPSLQHCTVHCCDYRSKGKDSEQPPLPLHSPALFKVVDLMTRALCDSHSLLELSWIAPLTSEAISNLWRLTIKSLQRLDMSFDHVEEDTTRNDEDKLVQMTEGDDYTFTLQHLTLHVKPGQPTWSEHILGQLPYATSLQRLCLRALPRPDGKRRLGGFQQMDMLYTSVLSDYLHDAPDTFQHLQLEHYHLDKYGLRTMLRALERFVENKEYDEDNANDGTQCPRLPYTSIGLSTLRLTNCTWPDIDDDYDDNDSDDDDRHPDDPTVYAQDLPSFLQKRTTFFDNELSIDSNLRELYIGRQDVSGKDCSLGRKFSRQMATSLLKKVETHGSGTDREVLLYPTIGSQLVTLGLYLVEADFFQHLSEQAHRVGSLQELCLYGLSKEASVGFAQGLPKLNMIRKLSLQQVATGAARGILQGLKGNKSVVEFTMDETGGFDAAQKSKIQAYRVRNQA